MIVTTFPDKNWLQKGSLELDDVTMSYAEDLSPVLRGLSLKIGAGEKVKMECKDGLKSGPVLLSKSQARPGR